MTLPGNGDGKVTRDLVHAYVDNELGAGESLQVGAAIGADPALAAEAQNALAIRKALAQHFPVEPVPEALRQRIANATGQRGRWKQPTWKQHTWKQPTWTALAAAVVLAIGLSSSATWFSLDGQNRDQVGGELVDRHMQRLFSGTTTDVASSDRHTVKPWFNGRVTYAPHVVDFASEGFPLAGGRIEVLGSKLVSSLIYKRRLHVISVTEMPADAGSERQGYRSINGYNVVSWTGQGLAYWAISDLNKEELNTFANLLKASASK
jgi:anti-sigma factor RsiW